MGEQTDEWERDRDVIGRAVPGPWKSVWDSSEKIGRDKWDRYDDTIITSEAEGLSSFDKSIVGVFWYDGELVGCTQENSAFIARARTRWPIALAAVCRLPRTADGEPMTPGMMIWVGGPSRGDAEVRGPQNPVCITAVGVDGVIVRSRKVSEEYPATACYTMRTARDAAWPEYRSEVRSG